MAFTFIHTGDLHLDSPLSGLSRIEDARTKDIAAAPRRAFAALVDFAIERQVNVFLIAGDLWDGDWRDVSAGLFVQSEAGRLREAGIGVFAVLGNHDAQSLVTDRIRSIDALHLFRSDAPSSAEWGEAVIHGMSYPEPAVRENLAARYPPAVPGRINIGLLHTSLDGREGHANYAPCNPADLAARGYHYFALGHVHTFELIQEEPASRGGTIAFCGVLQGRDVGEAGQKGAIYGKVEGDKVRVERIPFDFVTWFNEPVPLRPEEQPDTALRRALEAVAARATGDIAAVRLTLTGETSAHYALQTRQQELLESARMAAGGLAGGRLLLEGVRVATTPPSAAPPTLPSHFEDFLLAAARDDTLTETAAADVKRMVTGLPSGVRAALDEALPEIAAFETDGRVGDLLTDAALRVAARLAPGER
ncbi:MAG: DNA repair exonuclease [Pseudomonadota bacterium]